VTDAEPTRAAAPETLALRALQAAMGDAQSALGRRLRLIPTDLAAMSHLASAQDLLGPTELAGRLGLSPAATTEVVDRLERAGHLVRDRDPGDRRRIRLVTSAGARAEVMGQLGTLLDALDAIAADLDDDEREVVRRYLERVTAAYRDYGADR